ncbi:MAG: hypothetical protein IT427_10765 [Pirellulales bacterium]|nr:hypothetical protein [Pirellulales bacterium]
MSSVHHPHPEEVEHLLRNAELRNEIEPYLDEAVLQLNHEEVPTPVENEFLASMIAWERAPILPIFQWFSPELRLPSPDRLNDDEVHEALWNTIHKLFESRIVLDFTDHLTDRELYTLIWRDILPSPEKKIENSSSYLHWDCSDASGDAELWLRYYASPEEREQWDEESSVPLPPHEDPPYPRNLPRAPF